MSGSRIDAKKDAHAKKKLEQERLQIILNELLREEENKYCADCEAKGPRWASWNIGVFLCIRCAGIHRNLGVHVSKVKSVNLDTWTLEQVQSIRVFGNSVAKAVYEAHLPEHFRRPQTDGTLETFIRAKYELKRYSMKDWQPPKIDVHQLINELDNFTTRHHHGTKKVASSPSIVDHKTRQSSSLPPHSDDSGSKNRKGDGGKLSVEKRRSRNPSNSDDASKHAAVDLLGVDFSAEPSSTNQRSPKAGLHSDLFSIGDQSKSSVNAAAVSDSAEFGDFAAATPAPSSGAALNAPEMLLDTFGRGQTTTDSDTLFDLGERKSKADILALYGGKNRPAGGVVGFSTPSPSMFNATTPPTHAQPTFNSQGFHQPQHFAISTNQNQATSFHQPVGGASLYHVHQSQLADFAAFNPFNQSNASLNLLPFNQASPFAYAPPTNLATHQNFAAVNATSQTPPTFVQPSTKSLDLKAVQDQLAAIKLQKTQPQQPVKPIASNTMNSDFWQ